LFLNLLKEWFKYDRSAIVSANIHAGICVGIVLCAHTATADWADLQVSPQLSIEHVIGNFSRDAMARGSGLTSAGLAKNNVLAEEVHGPIRGSVSVDVQNLGKGLGEILRKGSGLLGEGLKETDGLLPEFSEQVGGPFSASSYAGNFGGTVPRGFRLIPYISIAERYDSNVFYAPRLPGLQREDYVTSITPGFSLLHGTSLVNTSLQANAIGEIYARNTELNYIGVDGRLGMDLSRLVQQVLPQMTMTIYDSVLYTPTPPAFIGGTAQLPVEQATEGSDQAPQLTQAELFVRGFQLSRINTFSNTSGVGTSYQMTPIARFQATYAYGFVQFGKSFVPQGRNVAFESRAHSVSAGPSMRVSSVDTINASYTYSRGEANTAFSLYESHGGFVGWNRILSPAFTMGVTAGATYTKQELPPGSTFPGDFAAFQGSASISWTKRNTTASLNYTSGVYPGYYIATGPILSHTVTASASQRLPDATAIAGSISYGRNEAMNPATTRIAQDVFFETVSGNLGYYYMFSRSLFSSLSYGFTYVKGTYFTGNVTDYTRHAVTLNLSMIFQ
jgi:hypothetical protein